MPFITPGPKGLNIPRKLLSLWKRLALTTNQADPVCCAPAWNLTYHRVACPESRLFYVASGSSLAIFREDLVGAPGIPCLYPVESGWMFASSLMGEDAPELLLDSLPSLIREYGRLPVFVLGGTQRHRPETRDLYAKLNGFYAFFVNSRSIQCSASLEGGPEGWASRRSANHRAKLRKAAKKASRRGMTFERARPSDDREAAAVFARIIAVERKSWKGINSRGILQSPSIEFYDELLRRLAREKAAYVIFARMDDRDIGFIFGGAAGKIYRGQQFSYDNELGDLSVGNLMQLEKVRWLSELGFERYDMGPITGSRMEYKNHWTENRHPIEAWTLRRRF
ncbi:MAG: GNAT family N-acetyltransferase [Desulfovibrio sp.]|nr:GNAT family N-acetyltransferase [Desulfovibrio sp.]